LNCFLFQAFRIVASVPEKLIRQASQTIKGGSKMLQKGFAEARERLSMGDRKSTASSFASTDSGNEDRVGVHHNHALLRAIRARMLPKPASHDSSSSDENRADSQSSLSNRKKFLTRNTSALSSACSFGSVSGDDLPMILSEEDEQNEDDTEDNVHERLAGNKEDYKEKSDEQNEEKVEENSPGEAQEKAPTKKNGLSEKKGKKRRKRSKDSRCVIQ
jgi:hypothetical protein